jgi:hypothetical protein
MQRIQKKLAHQKPKEDGPNDNRYAATHMQVHVDLIENINPDFRKISHAMVRWIQI